MTAVVVQPFEHGNADNTEKVEEKHQEGDDVQEHGQWFQQRIYQPAKPWDRMDTSHGLEHTEGTDEF